MKKQLAAIMAATMMMGTLAACGGGASTATSATDSTTTSAATSESSGEKTKITFWYSHSGDEAAAFEQAIASYNASQDKVEVEGLSVTDKQKIIVALSGSEAPDVIEVSNQDIINYANNGLIKTLNDKADADGYDVAGTYSAQALTANTLNDDLYGMPLAAMIIEMFYNKDILAEIGYDAPPTTMEELYEMAVKATELDADGNITRLGYPLFPLASARQEGIYAFGGRWWSEDGTTLTPDDPGILDSLHMNVEYRSLYGIDKVNEFVATANTNRYTENDMFFAGKQLFRFDGTWLDAMIKANNADLNYGVALIPGTEAHPEDQGASRYETNSLSHGGHRQGIQEYAVWHVLQPRQGVRRIYYGYYRIHPARRRADPCGQRAACAGQCSARRGSGGTAVPRSDGHGGRRKARQAHKEGGDQGVNP